MRNSGLFASWGALFMFVIALFFDALYKVLWKSLSFVKAAHSILGIYPDTGLLVYISFFRLLLFSANP